MHGFAKLCDVEQGPRLRLPQHRPEEGLPWRRSLRRHLGAHRGSAGNGGDSRRRANKLKLKKKQVDVARLYVWGTGYELPRGATQFEDGRVTNGTLVAISLGEPYAGPTKAEPAAVADAPAPAQPPPRLRLPPPPLRIADDAGRGAGPSAGRAGGAA